MKEIEIKNQPKQSFETLEMINTLCTNLTFAGDNIKTVMITSCHASEGKSTISLSLLKNMKALNKRAILLDMDLRRSNLVAHYGMSFGEQKADGITHYLSGNAELEDVVYRIDEFGSSIVPVTKTISNPAFLLNSPQIDNMFKQLRESYDYILVDAPPIGVVIDAAQIARYCDGTLVVIGYNEVKKKELIEVKAQLEQAHCPVIGAVINKAEVKRSGYYYKKDYYYTSMER